MALVPAICTQCGAQIEVDNTHEAGICKHCGTAFITEKVINNYTTNVINNNNFYGANVTITNTVDLKSAIDMAKIALKSHDYAKADEYLSMIKNNMSDGSDIISKIFEEADILNWYRLIYKSNPSEARQIFMRIEQYNADDINVWLGILEINNWAKDIIVCGNNILRLTKTKEQHEKLVYTTYIEKEFSGDKAISSEHTVSAIPKEYVIKNIDFQNYIVDKCCNAIKSYKNNMAFSMVKEGVDILQKTLPEDKREIIESELNKPAGGCYVATCVYGSYDCPEVWTLRRFRDYTLDTTWYGRLFIKCYYAISPIIVKWFGETKWFKAFWKERLDKMVSKLNSNGVENTRYQDKY